MWTDILEVRDVKTKVNYGLNKVRFPNPVPSGSKIRARATLAAVEPVPGGAQLTVAATPSWNAKVAISQPALHSWSSATFTELSGSEPPSPGGASARKSGAGVPAPQLAGGPGPVVVLRLPGLAGLRDDGAGCP